MERQEVIDALRRTRDDFDLDDGVEDVLDVHPCQFQCSVCPRYLDGYLVKLERSEYVPPTEKGLFMVRHIWEGQEQKYVVRSADEIVERRTIFTNLEPEVLSMINWEKFENAIKSSKISDKEKAIKEKQRPKLLVGALVLLQKQFFSQEKIRALTRLETKTPKFLPEGKLLVSFSRMKAYSSSSNGHHKKAYGGSSNGQHNAFTKEKPKEVDIYAIESSGERIRARYEIIGTHRPGEKEGLLVDQCRKS
ncbi:hypothetical protein SELMODRAFT_424894 [Selaginella moellendorffii]|uniref:Uncharacterized protein n=1 Tax=Selaginella moellendorffii TaxID=88036 RepID=D8SRC5_SELML|nr:hypothetical protein SELMODRAFT_424894 [Selaginella moellendorffii]